MYSALAHLCISAFEDNWILCAFLYPAQCTYCAPPQWMRALTLANVVHSRAHLSLWKSASFALSLSIPPFFTPFLKALTIDGQAFWAPVTVPGNRAKIDNSVSKLLGFETFANFFKVSVSVSENLVSEKKSQFRFRKNLVSEKSLGFGFGKGLTLVQLFGAGWVQKGVGGIFLKIRPHSCV